MLKLKEAMSDLLTVAENSLTDDVDVAFLAPGAEVAWDSCCDDDGVGGQLWVRIVSIIPTMPFPQADRTQKCGFQLAAVTLGVGVVRCAHTLHDDGEPPTGDEMTGDTNSILQDASDLSDAIAVYEWPNKIIDWTPQGPDGGCAGGEWQIYVRLQPCN